QRELVEQTIVLIDERLASLSGNPLASGTATDSLDTQLQRRIAEHPHYTAVAGRFGKGKEQTTDGNAKAQADAAANVSPRDLGPKLNDTAGDHRAARKRFQALAKAIGELGAAQPALRLTEEEREAIRAHVANPGGSPLPEEFDEPPPSGQEAK